MPLLPEGNHAGVSPTPVGRVVRCFSCNKTLMAYIYIAVYTPYNGSDLLSIVSVIRVYREILTHLCSLQEVWKFYER